MNNQLVSAIFREIAQLLEIKQDNPFRVRAYERAAQNIEGLSEDVANLLEIDKLKDVPGIGSDLSEKIKEIVKTGKLKYLRELKKTIPEGLLELLKIPSIGPKTAKRLYEEAGIKNIAGLEKAIKNNKLQDIFGIKEKTIANISSGIELVKRGRERMPLSQALSLSEGFINYLRQLPEAKGISSAGSLRRQKETVRDIDILIVSGNPVKIMDAFINHPEAGEILAKGETKSSLRTKNDLQVDCRVVEENSFGAALLYFTGSKNFNIKIRQLAIKKGLKINEYGVFKKDKFIAGRTENEIFKLLGLSYIEPELREDNGEIELAAKSGLPSLVELKDIKADLHLHSKWSDGNNSIEEMVLACKNRGYEYAALTDHSEGLKIAGGLSIQDLAAKKKEIQQLNKKYKDFRVLYAAEVDIDSEGRLDYNDEVLKEFDLVVAAIHSGFKQPKEQLTRRLVRACENKYVHIIAHPTGRLWGQRNSYEIDFDQFFKAARETNTALEINSFPERLDLNDIHARRAKEMGIKLAINTDSHSVEQLANMRFGIAVARRGWLTAGDVLNTLSLENFFKTIKTRS